MPDFPVGSESRPLRVAVIGSGPSAFYAVQALFKAENLAVRCDVFDRLPTPYGLVRGGVAPDHQKIKSVVKVYEKIAADPRFRFFGNVMLGRDVQVGDLHALYDHIVYATGNESDRKMGIPGEDLGGVHSATEFVGWYNGHPDFADRRFDLDRADTVAVVGNGNVAMDVTRILARGADELASTDIADYALAALRASRVRRVVVLGRRGPAQAAFSPKELEEIAELPGVRVIVHPGEAQLDPLSEAWLESQPRSARRNVELVQQLAAAGDGSDGGRQVELRFLLSPVELSGRDGRVCGLRAQHSELVADKAGTPRPRGIDRFSDFDVQLVFAAIGYRGVPIVGVPFDERSGTVPNDGGRVLETSGGAVRPGEYAVGWAKRGPTGLIGTNSPDSQETARAMIEDLAGVAAPPLESDDAERMPELLRRRGVDWVSYQDWQRLDAWEQAEGGKHGKVRHKLSDVAAMMETVRGLRG